MFPSTHGSSITVKVKKVKEYLKKNKIKSKIYTDMRIIDGELHQNNRWSISQNNITITQG
jgi:hypothetical protein